jgi:hypothetical protein
MAAMNTGIDTAALPGVGPYGRLAEAYAIAGVPTFPVCPRTKKPLVRNFDGRPPGLEAVKDWAKRHPHANIGFATRRARVVVLDADDAEAIEAFANRTSAPALRTFTPKGEHWFFADPQSCRKGGNRPTAMAYDLKGAKGGDFVIMPGSVSANGVYRLDDGEERDLPGLVAERLRRLTPLSDAAYASLMGPGKDKANPAAPRASLVRLSGQTFPVGHRNHAVFAYARAECRAVRRAFTDEDGGAELLARTLAFNAQSCVPPLEESEARRAADSAWRWDLKHMRRQPAARLRRVRESLIEHPGDARAVVLLLHLSQTTPAGVDQSLTPSHLSQAGLIPNWTKRDYGVAIAGLVRSQRLRVMEPPRRGRGQVGVYRLVAPLPTPVDIVQLCRQLGGDADAVALYALLVEQWGLDAAAELSLRGMCANRRGPFGIWDERRLRRARDTLVSACLLEPQPQPRRGRWAPRAVFLVRSQDVPDVPKITGNAPEESHRPPRVREPVSSPSRGNQRSPIHPDSVVIERLEGSR